MRRSQLQADERMLSGEGFILNVLAVLQQLAVKIKLDKVSMPMRNILSYIIVIKYIYCAHIVSLF